METDMTKGRPSSILLRFLIPIFFGNLFQQFYNVVDTVIVGRVVGAGALAAVGSTGTIMFLLSGIAQGMSTGFTVLTSQYYGAKDEKGVRRSVANALLLSLILTAAFTVAGALLMGPLLRLMNTPDDIYRDAHTYIMIITVGLIAMIMYNMSAALLRAIGNSKAPLYFLIFAVVSNIFLDLLLTMGIRMGVAGAALATVLSQAMAAVLCFIYIYRKAEILRPRRGEWRLSKEMTKAQLGISIPMTLQFAITSSGTMIMQSAVNLFGSTAVAGYTAANKVVTLLSQEMPSMGSAISTYCGQNYGNRQIGRVKKGVNAAVLIDTIYAVGAAVICVVILPLTLGIFFSGNEDIGALMPWAKTYVNVAVCFFIPLSYIFVFRNAMQGCGYGLLPMFGGIVEFVARGITAFISIHMMSYLAACFCDPAAWLTAGIFTGICYRFVIKDIEKTFHVEADEARERI
ncbi:MATE family efflux transporter [Bilifractor sp. LCP19S3_H10]|uniref:MATE family efflux transporter n=1 Tax=Bilifractor sp. LCP19S3_H10 TaxID=3438736 RepID=UPI003F9066C3